MREYPLEACSWGEWRGTRVFQRLVPAFVRRCLFHTMLLFKRMELPRHLALLVCSYVCTEGDEWKALAPERGE